MIGLVRMAANLADYRTRLRRNGHAGIEFDRGFDPSSRDNATRWPDAYPASREYYTIIDRISRGEQP